MTLQVIRGGRDLDAYEALVDALRAVIEQIVDEREAEHAKAGSWRWLTTVQAAELLGISHHRIAAKVREGKLPGRKYHGRTYVDREELEQAIDRSKIR